MIILIQSLINSLTPLVSNSSSIQFQRDCIRTNSCDGCRSWLCHNQGSANYDIVKGGLYEINFNASLSSATVGAVALQLYRDGEPIPGSLMVEQIATAGDYANVGINKKITVCCNGNANISVRAVPTIPSATTPNTALTTQIPIILNANLSIERKG